MHATTMKVQYGINMFNSHRINKNETSQDPLYLFSFLFTSFREIKTHKN